MVQLKVVDINKKRKSNNEEVRSNKKEEVAVAPGPLDLASLSSPAAPPLLPEAKAADTCEGLREELRASRGLVNRRRLSYLRMSLLTPKVSDYDGEFYKRLAINADVSVDNSQKFIKLKLRLTDKGSEYYTNLPEDWVEDTAYGAAWMTFKGLPKKTRRWIGKACYRQERRDRTQKLKLVPLIAMVAWTTDDQRIEYRLWFEDAVIEGVFDWTNGLKHYTAHTTPIHNFQPQGWQPLKI